VIVSSENGKIGLRKAISQRWKMLRKVGDLQLAYPVKTFKVKIAIAMDGFIVHTWFT
jgi:hypothetical protein